MAVPLLKGQLSVREIINGARLVQEISKDAALFIDHIDGPYSENEVMRAMIYSRGL